MPNVDPPTKNGGVDVDEWSKRLQYVKTLTPDQLREIAAPYVGQHRQVGGMTVPELHATVMAFVGSRVYEAVRNTGHYQKTVDLANVKRRKKSRAAP